MDLDEYQATTEETDNKDLGAAERLAMASMGLAGEAGEAIDLVKKHLFQGHDLDRAKVAEELGDTLCYVAFLARYLGIPLSEIAAQNIQKRRARYPGGFSATASRERAVR